MRSINAHSSNKGYNREAKCPYCSRRFQTADELTLHIVTRHTQVGIKRGPAQAGNSK